MSRSGDSMVATSNAIAGSNLFFMDRIYRQLSPFEQSKDWQPLPCDDASPGSKALPAVAKS